MMKGAFGSRQERLSLLASERRGGQAVTTTTRSPVQCALQGFEQSSSRDGGSSISSTTITEKYDSYNALTDQLAGLSTGVFLLLFVPQIVKNASALMGGNASALSVLPWVGYTTGLMGNTLLLCYFAGKRERTPAIVQGLGMFSTIVLLSQICMAGYMPVPAFAFLSSLTAASFLFNLLEYNGKLNKTVWDLYLGLVGVIGLGLLPQSIWATFFKSESYVPGMVAAGLGVLWQVLERTGGLPNSLRGKWSSITAWTANFLFMFMPVAQLVSNLENPASLAGVSVTTTLLVLTGNGLMVPRALFTRDLVWFAGSFWGACVGGWGVLFTLFSYGYISGAVFLPLTAIYVLYLGTTYYKDTQAHAEKGAQLLEPEL
eukprot:jgi/Chlat1/1397/Chrsp12S02052